MKVHLVDGTFELFRAYYGSPSSTTPDGFEIGAARGLLRSMLALLGEPGVTHVAIAFDHVIESFRNDLYPGYKTGDGIDPTLYAQFGPAEDACRALGHRHVADDRVRVRRRARDGGCALRGSAGGRAGRHLLARQGSRAVCARRRASFASTGCAASCSTSPACVAKFGVRPKSIPDWLALVGDSADGYPGIPRWGAKSAAAVLAVYEQLERIPDDAAAWSVDGARRGGAGRKLARESRRGASCSGGSRRCAPTCRSRSRSTTCAGAAPDAAALAALAEQWDDGAIVERAARAALDG